MSIARVFLKTIRNLLSKNSRSYFKNHFPRLFYIYLEISMGKRGHQSYSFDGEDMIIRPYNMKLMNYMHSNFGWPEIIQAFVNIYLLFNVRLVRE